MLEDGPPARTGRPRRAFLLVTSALVALGVGLGVGLATTGSPGVDDDPRAAGALLESVVRAADASSGFHYASSSVTSSASSSLTQVTIGDAGRTSGRQDITIGNSHFTVVVVGKTAYFDGDAAATSAVLGLPADTAARYAGRWISLVPGDAPYQSVYAAVTVSSAMHDNITFTPRSETSRTKYERREVIGISGPLTPVDGHPAGGSATLYVAASRPHLPVGYVEKGTVGTGSSRTAFDFTIRFSSWGAPVSVPAPPGAVTFATLGPTSGGPGGPPGSSGPTLLASEPSGWRTGLANGQHGPDRAVVRAGRRQDLPVLHLHGL